MTHRHRLLAGLIVIGLVTAACGNTTVSSPPASQPPGSTPAAATPETTSPSTGPVRGGTVTMSMFEEPDNLDPTFSITAGAREVFINMCERLYDVDADGNLVPQLAAEMPKVSADGLAVTIELRSGVKFNDGTPMDAAAVVTTLERNRTAEGSRRKSELGNVAKVEASGENGVILTLSKPGAAPLAATLSDRAGMILSPAQLTNLGADFGKSPVCVGPFKFADRVLGDHITLERSADYYDADHVYLDKIIYRPIADGTVRTANLRSGDLQLVDRLSTTDVAAIQSDPKFATVQRTSNGYGALWVNIANANGMAGAPGPVSNPLSNAKLREAFDLALDREQINQIIYNGLQVVGCGPISTVSIFYDPDPPCLARDLEGAKRLVAESGVPTPIQVEFQITNSTSNVRLGELLQSQVAEAGFALKVLPIEFVTTAQNLDEGKYEISLEQFSGRVDPDADIYPFHYSSGTSNRAKTVDPALDALLDQARAEADFATRKALYKQIVAKVRAQRALIYFQYANNYAAHVAGLQGFEMYIDGMPRLKSAHLVGG